MKKIVDVEIITEYIKLDQLLKYSGVVMSGSEAKELIAGSEVMVNGETITQRGKKLRPGDIVTVLGTDYRITEQRN